MPNTLIKNHKGHDIFIDEKGRFNVVINKRNKIFSSMKSAENAIGTQSVVDFKPVEALMINDEDRGYHRASKYVVKKVKLVGYEEQKEFRRDLRRSYVTDTGDRIQITGYGRSAIYPLSSLEKLTEMAKERTALEKLQYESEKKAEKIGEQWEKMVVSYDPRPDAK